MDIYLSEENLTENRINELLSSNSFYKFIGEQGVCNNLNLLVTTDLKDSLSYIHLLGMIKGASLHQDGISNNIFVELIDTINTIEIDEFERLLPRKSDIELSNDTIKEFSFKMIR